MTVTPASVRMSEATSAIPRAWLWGFASLSIGGGFTSLSSSFPQLSDLRGALHRRMNYFTPRHQLHSVDAPASGVRNVPGIRTEGIDIARTPRSIVVSSERRALDEIGR